MTREIPKTVDSVAAGCDRVMFGCLVAIVAALPIVFNPAGNAYFESPKMALFRMALLVAVAACATKMVVTRRFTWIRTPLDWPLAALVASGAAATALALDRHVSFWGRLNRFDGLLHLVCYVVLFYVTVGVVRRRSQLRTLVGAFCAGAGMVSIVAVLERLGIHLFPSGGAEALDPTRASSTYGSPMYLAAYLSLAIPASLALLAYLAARGSGDGHSSSLPTSNATYALLALVAVESAALVASQGRAAWLGVGVAVAAMGALWLTWGPHEAWRPVLLAALLASALAAGVIAATAAVGQAPSGQSVAERARATAEPSSGTAFNRLYYWRMTLPMIASRPLFGYGLDSYLELFGRFRPADWYMKIKEDAVPDKPHNDLLQMAVGQGLVGLASYVAVLGALFWSGIRALRRARTPIQTYALIGLLGALIAYLVQLEFGFNVVGTAPLFWTAAGLAIAFAIGDERSARTVTLELPGPLGESGPIPGAIRPAMLLALAGLVVWATFGLGASIASDMYADAGDRALSQNDPAGAARFFHIAAGLSPAESRYPLLIAAARESSYLAFSQSSDAAAALEAAKTAARLDPYVTQPIFREASVYRAMGLRGDHGAFANAAVAYRRILRIDRYNADAYYNLGLTTFELGAAGPAEAILLRAARLRPDHERTYTALGDVYVKLGRLDDARAAFERALSINSRSLYARDQLSRLSTSTPSGAR